MIEDEIIRLGKLNRGFRNERCYQTHGELEKAFYKAWRKQNIPQGGINYGKGILQDILTEEDFNSPLKPKWVVTKINSRDRFIVATAMQWLGTNVGFCFLKEVLAKCGYKIVKYK